MHPHNCVTQLLKRINAVGYDDNCTIFVGNKTLHFVVTFFLEFLVKHPNVNLTLEKFGEKLGIKKSALSLIENEKNNLTEQMAKSICREFRVNYFWLTEEKGEPFIDIPDTALDDLADDYDLDNIDKKIIQKYLELSADQRDVIKAYLRSLCEDEKNG